MEINAISFMNKRDVKISRGGSHRYKIKKLKFFEEIISLENLFGAWRKFKKGKMKKKDVQEFALNLEDNIFGLHEDLKSGNYHHSNYTSFFVRDPKLRHIHKVIVRDRLMHHAVCRIIEPIFEKTFIFDSYSSRRDKGTYKAIRRFKKFAWKLSQNDIKTVWVLKCDVRKFFDSVNHNILLGLIKNRIKDEQALGLLEKVIKSYNKEKGKGLPLGNLTSQLFPIFI